MDRKKGSWTSAEDEILREFVKKHGKGNWNAVEKATGLARCGKSCRLRWENHLSPDVKKGSFSPEQERRIAELHAMWGNKWARMALEFPGRSDNDIKNYWNTRIKRHQRSNIPIYPDDILQQIKNTTQPGPDAVDSSADESLNGHDPSCSGFSVLPNIDIDYEKVRVRVRERPFCFPPANLSMGRYTPPNVGGDLYVSDFSVLDDLDPDLTDLLGNDGGNFPVSGNYSSSPNVAVSTAPELELPSFQTHGIQQNGGVQESTPLNRLPASGLDDALEPFYVPDPAQPGRRVLDIDKLHDAVMADTTPVIEEATALTDCSWWAPPE